MKVSQLRAKQKYLAIFNRKYKGSTYIDHIAKQAASYQSLVKRKPLNLKGKTNFNSLSVNALTVVASYFSLRGKDFSKLRLVNKKMKKAYERHVLGFINVERLVTEMGPAREKDALARLDELLKLANELLPPYRGIYQGPNVMKPLPMQHQMIKVQFKDGLDLFWRNKDHKELETAVIKTFVQVFCTKSENIDDQDDKWDENEPYLSEPTKLFKCKE